MLLVAVLVLLGGIGGCLVAAVRWSGGCDLSPLFETSLVVAVVGFVLTLASATVESARQVWSLTGWFAAFWNAS